MEAGPTLVVIRAARYLLQADLSLAGVVALEVKSVCCINGGVVFVRHGHLRYCGIEGGVDCPRRYLLVTSPHPTPPFPHFFFPHASGRLCDGAL